MKKTCILLLIVLLAVSCKNETVTTPETIVGEDGIEKTVKQNDGLTLLKGQFLYLADAAVLQTHREIYGVVIDEKMHELNEKAQPFKVENYDWVNVEIRGKISRKPEGEEGWDFRIKIEEILNVTAFENDGTDIIKIGD